MDGHNWSTARQGFSRSTLRHRAAAANNPDTARLEKLIGMPTSPVLLRLNGTVIGALDAKEFITANSAVLLGAPTPQYHSYRDGTTMAEVADACIYRGRGAHTLVRPDPSYAADAAYAVE